MPVKGSGGGSLTGVSSIPGEIVDSPWLGYYGLMPGGNLAVRVVVSVAADATECDGSTVYAVVAGLCTWLVS